MADVSNSKILYLKDSKDLSSLIELYEKYRPITLAGGCFDILHYGHIQFLRQAKAQGGSLVILLESDDSLLKRKKRKPIHTQGQRAALIAALSYVDVVIVLPYLSKDEEYEHVTQALKPSVIAITEGDPFITQKEHQAKQVGGKLTVVTKRVKNLSTSSITNNATISGNKAS